MAMKPLASLLLSAFAEKLAQHDFIYNKPRKACYERMFVNGRQGVFLATIHHVNDFDVVMSFGIYFEILDKLIASKDAAEMAKKGKNFKLYSMGIELGNYLGTGQKRWRVESEQDVIQVAESLYASFLGHGLPYFEKYSNLKKAYELIAGNQGKSTAHCAFNDTRCINHVAMAMLLGFDQSYIDKIIQEDTQFLSGLSMKYDLTRFLEFVEKAKQLPEWPKN
jgi:hypothetical protein